MLLNKTNFKIYELYQKKICTYFFFFMVVSDFVQSSRAKPSLTEFVPRKFAYLRLKKVNHHENEKIKRKRKKKENKNK